ncbi:MAG: hypothetical protein CMP59_08670 [Flavobacteriales bacterium]|nr:hypothetical protein [Flavobacteriales bacterium]
MLNQVAGKIVKDSLPADMSIQKIYSVSSKILFRFLLLAILSYSLFYIKIGIPSEKQKMALIGTCAIILFALVMMESKNKWERPITIEK